MPSVSNELGLEATYTKPDFKGLLDKRHTYKPFNYPWAYDAYKQHESMHWMPHEIILTDDIVDWNKGLNAGQKDFLEHLFLFFTQADVSVASAYSEKFLPLFGRNPEIAMMMLSFGAREAIHVDAYSLLMETLGYPESTYSAFMQYKAMLDKYTYLTNFDMNTHMDMAQSLAVYSGFTEGMQLYSSFAMLMHFERLGKMPGMTNIVRWSMRDEQCHSDNMIKLFNTFIREYMEEVDTRILEKKVHQIAEQMVSLEDAFIDMAFTISGDINAGLPASQEPITERSLKEYIRHITDYRLAQMGFSPLYGRLPTPLKWLDNLMLSTEHANFFETRPTEYSKGSISGAITQW